MYRSIQFCSCLDYANCILGMVVPIKIAFIGLIDLFEIIFKMILNHIIALIL